jgi:hypothetical protein
MEVYAHLRFLMSMILGLGITRILAGLARMVQAPAWRPGMAAHVVWSLVVLTYAVQFWWWEFALHKIPVWHFVPYLIVLFYAFLLFLLAALLFPDVAHEHAGHEGYFLQQRGYFFSIFALCIIVDILDTALKGKEYFIELGPEYLFRSAFAIVLALIAARVRSARSVAVIGLIWLAYNTSWILRFYDMHGLRS